MKKWSAYIKDFLITISILLLSYGISLLLQYVFEVHEHITTFFVFAVFLVSLFTKGYFYSIFATFVGTIAVDYAFTFPYFSLTLSNPANFLSSAIMIIVAILTSTLTTKQKEYEATKAEGEKERMRANLMRAVSHDLRTPLTTIYGSSTTLLDNNNTLTDIQKNKIIEGIKEDSEWLIRIVENLLSITRIDSGKVKISKTSTALDELIDSVMLKFKKRYPEQDVYIDIPDDIILIPMDAILIEQVILNILENAVQHAANMTKLSLCVFTIKNRVIFEIRDNGCGINPERLDKIFSGYYEEKDEPIDSKKRNAGIGLSVCATIIKAHGGDITAENSKNGGAVFRFTLDTEDT